MVKKNLTNEQKVNLYLFDINRNIKYGFTYLFVGILILIQSIVFPEKYRIVFMIVSTLGVWALFIALILISNRDNNFIKKEIENATK